jgi:hypothetical protein
MTENAREDAEVSGPERPPEEHSLAAQLRGETEGAGPESADPDPDPDESRAEGPR